MSIWLLSLIRTQPGQKDEIWPVLHGRYLKNERGRLRLGLREAFQEEVMCKPEDE